MYSLVTMPGVIQTTTLRNNLSDILKTIEKKKDYLLVTERGKKARAVLVNLDFFEDMLALNSPSYLKSIKEARRQIKKGEYFTHNEVFGEL